MYHERQKWALCGVHAINNLLQRRQFDKASFDAVCEELVVGGEKESSSSTISAFWKVNPHRSAFGLGNYDVNVLMVILERQGFVVKWHDVRQDITPAMLEAYFVNSTNNVCSNDNNTPKKDYTATTRLGIVVNLPSTSLWGRLTKGRHWFTLLWSNDTKEWTNLDSELQEPKLVGNFEACAKLLQEWQHLPAECHILLVRR